MSVRCPKCQKKHVQPYPNRCGCGQSLVSAVASHRLANPRFALPRRLAPEPENARILPVWMNPPTSLDSSALDLGDNEW